MWTETDTSLDMYKVQELAKIHRGFGNPSVKETENPLLREEKEKFNSNLRSEIQRI